MSNPALPVKIALVSPDIPVPAYKSDGAACFDFNAHLRPEQICPEHNALVIPPGGIADVGIGLIFEIPKGWRLDVHSRSGTWFGHRVRAAAQGRGTIDSDFRGEVVVSVENRGQEPFLIKQGDRIAQGELNQVTQAAFTVMDLEDLSKTNRGAGGFGSTGSN